MQPQQSSRIDLVEVKALIVKKVGADKLKRYFYYLSRFLSQKLRKNEFDKLCLRLLGRENIPLHNHFIKTILKNACQANSPPTVQQSGTPKSVAHASNISPSRHDGHEQSVTNFQSQNQNATIWSNGVLPVSPRKVEMENGTLSQCDYQRPIQHLQAVAELPENEIGDAIQRPAKKSRIHDKGPTKISIVEDGEEVEQLHQLSFSRSPLTAPLGIPYCSASVGGTRKAVPVISSDFVSCCDSGSLYDTDTLRRHMQQIAMVQGLGGVSVECANMLNNMVDVYLKRLIKSCVDLVGARTTNQSRKPLVSKQQIQGKVMNSIWPNDLSHVHSVGGLVEIEPEHRPPCSVSLHDFKVAMQLNPRQLGEDWPLLLEKISMLSFDE
ncbi:hypothetical protein PIB30_013207 [Stylosanthes scabra]|uniref:Transcriptional coactivator Hfi1/Transcriptional adapter 1 n=1 Tax=Stylosanthes scabra TaxID=79078 RepID=A0ABU6Q6C4_9FABA|nr:hypothetical protein [Stylosanthes scabra]